MELRWSRLSIIKTHPSLHREILWVGLGHLALALNFWFSNPAFHPFGISNGPIAIIFFLFGAALLLLLRTRSLLRIRTLLTGSVAFTVAWAGGNTQQFFQGKASLQLPILFFFFMVGWEISIMFRLTTAADPITEASQ